MAPRWRPLGGAQAITIPAEPADPELHPLAFQPFGAVPPLITNIDLSVNDRWLYVSCWGVDRPASCGLVSAELAEEEDCRC